MRVYISNTEMPKSCRRCDFSQPDGCGFICPIVVGKPIIDSLTHSRHARCPLIPIPPNGRLIDADALIKDGWTLRKEAIRMGGYVTHELPLNNPSIPTIIEAEGER